MFKLMKKMPAGTILIPMFISAILSTIFPNMYSIGGTTVATFSEAAVGFCIGFISFVSGSIIRPKTLGALAKKHGVILLFRIILAMVFGYAFFSIFGDAGVFGISTVAFIVVICSVNPAIYLALVQEYGDESDFGFFSILGIMPLSVLPMIVYSLSRGTAIDWMPLISTVIPILAGFIIGNLDKDFADFLKPGVSLIMPFLGWSLGAGINLRLALSGGVQGLILALFMYVVFYGLCLLFERLVMKSNGIISLAMGTVAGVSISNVNSIAIVDQTARQYVQSAQAQVAILVILTAVLTPIVTTQWAKMQGISRNSDEKEEAVKQEA